MTNILFTDDTENSDRAKEVLDENSIDYIAVNVTKSCKAGTKYFQYGKFKNLPALKTDSGIYYGVKEVKDYIKWMEGQNV